MAVSLKADIVRRLAAVPEGSMIRVPGNRKLVRVTHPPYEIEQLCDNMSYTDLAGFRDQLSRQGILERDRDTTAMRLTEKIDELLEAFDDVQTALTNDGIEADINASDDRFELRDLMNGMGKAAAAIGSGEQTVRKVLYPKTWPKYNEAKEYDDFINELGRDPPRSQAKRSSSKTRLQQAYDTRAAQEEQAREFAQAAQQYAQQERQRKKPRRLVPELVKPPVTQIATTAPPARTSPQRPAPVPAPEPVFAPPPVREPPSSTMDTEFATKLSGITDISRLRQLVNVMQTKRNGASANLKAAEEKKSAAEKRRDTFDMFDEPDDYEQAEKNVTELANIVMLATKEYAQADLRVALVKQRLRELDEPVDNSQRM